MGHSHDFDGTSIGWVYCGFIGKLNNWHWLMVTGETNWWLLTIPNCKYHKNQAFHAYASVSSFLHTNLVVFTQKMSFTSGCQDLRSIPIWPEHSSVEPPQIDHSALGGSLDDPWMIPGTAWICPVPQYAWWRPSGSCGSFKVWHWWSWPVETWCLFKKLWFALQIQNLAPTKQGINAHNADKHERLGKRE